MTNIKTLVWIILLNYLEIPDKMGHWIGKFDGRI